MYVISAKPRIHIFYTPEMHVIPACAHACLHVRTHATLQPHASPCVVSIAIPKCPLTGFSPVAIFYTTINF